MKIRRSFLPRAAVLAAALLVASCSDSNAPTRPTTAKSAASHDAAAADTIGTAPANFALTASASRSALSPTDHANTTIVLSGFGLRTMYSEVGKLSLSLDGSGSNSGSASIRFQKPAGATVRRAFLYAASTGFTGYQLSNGIVALNGHPVNWDATIANGIHSYNAEGEVTSIVKPLIDAAPAGIGSITVTEGNPYYVEGEVLAVVFDDPSQQQDNTVTLLFGAQQTTGDNFGISLANPLDKTDPNLKMDMSLGISYGYQSGSYMSQSSTVTVNGSVMTTCAGGQDDGQPANGALITVGGIGDTDANPNCSVPNGPRTDDELYDLRPFTHQGDTQIAVHTVNPSNDDNIFFSALFLTVSAQVAAGPGDLTPPVVTPTVTGTLGTNGWYTSDVHVSFAVSDPESPISSSTGCGASTVNTNGTQTFTCTATSAGGTTTKSVTVKRDATVPVVTATPTGTLGLNGWYTSDVSIAWSTSAPGPSGITANCPVATQTTDTQGATFTCTATTGAGLTGTGSVTIKRDASPPVVSGTVSGTLGNAGWYTSDVTVSWNESDNISGITSQPCAASTLSADNAGVTYSCSATNGAGLQSTATQFVKRDATKPVIGYSAHPATYTVDQTIAITCSASDAMSGLASSTCANIGGDAYTFTLGGHSYTATAVDVAGNSNSASTSFTVVVTQASVCTLVQRWVANAGNANSLCVKVNHGDYPPFQNELSALAGKKLTTEHAAILSQLVNALAGM